MLESFYYTSLWFKISCLLFVLTAVFYIAAVFLSKRLVEKFALLLFTVSFAACTVLIISRWIEAGRPPFKSFYESLIFAIWTVSLVSLVVEYRFRIKMFGLISSLSILGIFLMALQKRDAEVIVLPPALQTWVFIPHVVSYFLAYGALFVAGISAALHLIFPSGMSSRHSINRNGHIDFSEFSYQIARFGFLFLTAGLLLGAWWGQNAWSNYWGWDPKENWSLISWLIFAAYLHFRNISDWSKERLSWILILGVFAIIFTYLGMECLPTTDDSIHVYGNE